MSKTTLNIYYDSQFQRILFCNGFFILQASLLFYQTCTIDCCDIWYLQKREEDRQQCKKYLWNICQKTWENQIGSRIEIWQLWDWLFFQSLLRFVFSATRHWCRQKKKRRKKERDLKISFEKKNSQGKKKTDSRTYSNIIWEMFNLWSTTTTRRNKISFFFSRLFF